MAYSRSRLLMKTRKSPPPRQTAMPRCLKPWFGSARSYAFGSKIHSSSPVSASSAATRLYIVGRYNTLSIITGVAWNGPGRAPSSGSGISRGSHCQAISSRSTLAAVTWPAREYFVCAWSAPT